MKKIDFAFLETIMPLHNRILEKKAILDQNRPLSYSILEKLRANTALEWTYNSNGIEGNTLTVNETRVVLETGITIGGKSLREHFEVLNHDKAITYLEKIVKDNERIRAIDILKMHEIIMVNIDDEYGGRLRSGMVRIVGANFTPPAPTKVSDLLDNLIDYVNSNPDSLSTPVLSAIFHHLLVWIHPFFDGNGRTGRLAMNLMLMNAGYPPSIILKNDRKKYYNALNEANNGKYEKITLLVLQGLERTLNIYIDAIPGEYELYEPVANVAMEPNVPYGIEYISLLARRGEINAHKEGRNWHTTKKAVLEYAQNHNKKRPLK